ncbi:MAG TPA: CDGSH iron-sulfur domain-containing protein [Candidatus Omnitrophota bacterium]|nr:CDGSH iron-sulfur domain-containing protein [Candidatus Omnitrophota bacterium]
MTTPHIFDKKPCVMEVEPGKYAWCACGQSKKQPYCDGSHAGSGFKPLIETVTEKKRVAWCNCKHSAKAPFCDGSHSKL